MKDMENDSAVGEKFDCGVGIADLPPQGKNRGKRVLVLCKCGNEHFPCRVTVARRGARKGCSACRVKSNRRNREKRLLAFSPEDKVRIFGLAMEKTRRWAAQEAGVDHDLVGFIWREVRDRLARMPEQDRCAIARMAERNVAGAAEGSGLTPWEVLWIRSDWRRKAAAGTAESQVDAATANINIRLAISRQDFHHAIEIGMALDPDSSQCKDAIQLIEERIQGALQALDKPSRGRRIYTGEFSPAELGSAKASRYGWVYAILSRLPSVDVRDCFGADGTRFMEVCHFTKYWRRVRRSRHLNDKGISMTQGPQLDAMRDITGLVLSAETVRDASMPQTRSRQIGDGRRLEKCHIPEDLLSNTLAFCGVIGRISSEAP